MAYSLNLALIARQIDSRDLPSSQCILASELQARGRHCLQSQHTKSGWNLRNSAHTSSRLHTPVYINTHTHTCMLTCACIHMDIQCIASSSDWDFYSIVFYSNGDFGFRFKYSGEILPSPVGDNWDRIQPSYLLFSLLLCYRCSREGVGQSSSSSQSHGVDNQMWVVTLVWISPIECW